MPSGVEGLSVGDEAILERVRILSSQYAEYKRMACMQGALGRRAGKVVTLMCEGRAEELIRHLVDGGKSATAPSKQLVRSVTELTHACRPMGRVAGTYHAHRADDKGLLAATLCTDSQSDTAELKVLVQRVAPTTVATTYVSVSLRLDRDDLTLSEACGTKRVATLSSSGTAASQESPLSLLQTFRFDRPTAQAIRLGSDVLSTLSGLSCRGLSLQRSPKVEVSFVPPGKVRHQLVRRAEKPPSEELCRVTLFESSPEHVVGKGGKQGSGDVSLRHTVYTEVSCGDPQPAAPAKSGSSSSTSPDLAVEATATCTTYSFFAAGSFASASAPATKRATFPKEGDKKKASAASPTGAARAAPAKPAATSPGLSPAAAGGSPPRPASAGNGALRATDVRMHGGGEARSWSPERGGGMHRIASLPCRLPLQERSVAAAAAAAAEPVFWRTATPLLRPLGAAEPPPPPPLPLPCRVLPVSLPPQQQQGAAEAPIWRSSAVSAAQGPPAVALRAAPPPQAPVRMPPPPQALPPSAAVAAAALPPAWQAPVSPALTPDPIRSPRFTPPTSPAVDPVAACVGLTRHGFPEGSPQALPRVPQPLTPEVVMGMGVEADAEMEARLRAVGSAGGGMRRPLSAGAVEVECSSEWRGGGGEGDRGLLSDAYWGAHQGRPSLFSAQATLLLGEAFSMRWVRRGGGWGAPVGAVGSRVRLPIDVLLEVTRHLSPWEVCVCAAVCVDWRAVAVSSAKRAVRDVDRPRGILDVALTAGTRSKLASKPRHLSPRS